MCATSRDGVAAVILVESGAYRTTVGSSGRAQRKSYKWDATATIECLASEGEGKDARGSCASTMLTLRNNGALYASECLLLMKDPRAADGVRRSLSYPAFEAFEDRGSALSELRVYTELRRMALPPAPNCGVPSR